MGRRTETPELKESKGSQAWQRDAARLRAAEDANPSATKLALPWEEQLYRTLVEQIPAITYIYESGPQRRWHYVSPKIETLLGFSPQDWLSNPALWLEQIHPEDRGRVQATEERARRAGDAMRCEYRLRRRDGSYRWFRDEAVALSSRPDGPTLFHGVLYDIHEPKQSEEALRESGQRLSLALDSSGLSLWDCDIATGEVYLDENWSVMRGGPKQATRTTVQELFIITHAEDRERIFQEALRVLKGEIESYAEEHRVRDAQGNWMWIRSTGRVVERNAQGRAVRAIGTNEDITKRKEAERKLRESQDLLRHTVNNAPLVAFSLDPKGKFLLSEGRGLTALGLAPGQAVGQSIFDIYKDNPDILENFRRALGGEEFIAITRLPERNFSYEVAWMPLRDAQGKITGVTGVATDITEREQAETALRESEERLRLAVHAADMGVWEWDAATDRSTWDAGLHRIMGVSPEKFDGRTETLASIIHPEDREKFLASIEQAAREGELFQADFRVVRPDGRTVWIADRGRPEFDGSGKLLRFRGVARDVTRQRELSFQLERAQKMEAVGQLAGGIAHDFNNLLMVIRGNMELVREQAGGNPRSERTIGAVLQAADRAAAITRQLLAFSRRQVLQPKVVELGSIVSETAGLLRRVIGPAIQLELQMPSEPLYARVDASQLDQVVVNLVINARDAMPEGGRVTLRVDRAPAGSEGVRRMRFPQMPEADYVRLTVSDTGTGMDAATQARIFEPFFTTKELGKGTGLGLATVYGIVKQSDGWIWVDSEVGKGASFEVYLPEVAAPQRPEPTQAARSSELRGTETLVVVDDEEDILELAAGYLSNLGYQVIAASSGDQAMEKIGAYSKVVDVLITDAQMPGISGLRLAQAVRAARPETKVLYISGYAEDSGIPARLPREGEDFLQKPFELSELAAKIRELLRK